MTEHGPNEDATQVDVPVTDRTMAMPASPSGPPPSGPPPIPPPERPGDPRWWILAALLAAIVIAGISLLLLDNDDDTVTSITSTTVAGTTTSLSTTSTSETTTSTTEATTTTTSPPSTVDPARCESGAPDDPDSSVEALYEAYTLGDLECAHQVATDDAVVTLFDIPGGGGGWTYQGCSEQLLPEPHLDCAYTFPGGATHFKTNYSDTDGWVIFEVHQTTD